jgi:hypothetical protein
VTWELVGLAMRQVAVEWNTTGEFGGHWSECGKGGRCGAQWEYRVVGKQGGGKRGALVQFSWWCAQMAKWQKQLTRR